MRLARTTAPPPRKVRLAGVEPAISGSQSRRGSQLPHNQNVTGRGRTCDAPRFKRALYRLSYGHVIWAATIEPAASRTGALTG